MFYFRFMCSYVSKFNGAFVIILCPLEDSETSCKLKIDMLLSNEIVIVDTLLNKSQPTEFSHKISFGVTSVHPLTQFQTPPEKIICLFSATS